MSELKHFIDTLQFKVEEAKKIELLDSNELGELERDLEQHSRAYKIAEKLKADGIRFSLTIVGEGVPAALAHITDAAGVAAETKLLEASADIPAILADSDIFLSTSTSEGMPVSLLEAAATGRPCVSYAFPSLAEINSPEPIVDAVPLNEIALAVKRIKHWNANCDAARSFGAAAAAKTAKRFGAAASAKQWEEFLRSTFDFKADVE